MNTEQNVTTIYSNIMDLFEKFKENHTQHIENKNKSAGRRARKEINEIKKLIVDYRKNSVQYDK